VKRLLNFTVKLLVSGGLLCYLVASTDLAGFAAVFTRAIPAYFLLAVLFFVLSNALGAVQWYALLRAQDLTISLRQATVLYWIGVFFNNVLLGNIGGDALRIYDVRRITGDGTGGAAATFLDRFVGLFSTCTLAMLAFATVDAVRDANLVSVVFPVWLALVAFLAIGLSRRASGLLERLVCPLLPATVARLVVDLRQSIVVYRHRLGLLAAVWCVSLGVQLSRILVYWSAGLAVGLHAGLWNFVGFQPTAAIIAAVPISIGGLGVRENVLVQLFGSLGFEESLALAMSLLGYASGILASLLGGLAFAVRRIERRGEGVETGEQQ